MLELNYLFFVFTYCFCGSKDKGVFVSVVSDCVILTFLLNQIGRLSCCAHCYSSLGSSLVYILGHGPVLPSVTAITNRAYKHLLTRN